MKNDFDVAVIGAGPAGLFAAQELALTNLKVVVIEAGAEPVDRDSNIQGIGGAGCFSDGTLNLTTEIGGDPLSFGQSPGFIKQLIEEFDRKITDLGGREKYSGVNSQKIKDIQRKAQQFGIQFVPGKQRHLGTENVRKVSTNLFEKLKKEGITFLPKVRVEKILKNTQGFSLILANGRELKASSIIACPGRIGSYWLMEQAKNLGIEVNYGPIDVGVRIEFPAEIYEEMAETMYDAKFIIQSSRYDDKVRTFCTNHQGFVVSEDAKEYVLVNGASSSAQKSDNTNLAILVHIELTHPLENTSQYGRSIAQIATVLGGGRPLIQRLRDLKAGQRSTWSRIQRSPILPTLKEVTPGDISMAFPARIVTNILEALEKLNYLLPGLANDSTLIYAPEIKFYATRYQVTPFMETNLKGFYVAGDASGHSRGIVYAAITGILAARGVKNSLSDKIH